MNRVTRVTRFSIFNINRSCFFHLKSECISAGRRSVIYMYTIKFCVFQVFLSYINVTKASISNMHSFRGNFWFANWNLL